MSLIDADKRRSDPADFDPQCTDTEAQPPLPPQDRRQRLPVAILCVALVVAVALYLAGLRNVDLQAMTGLGLISVLTVSTMLGPGLIVLGFIGTLSLNRRRTWLLGIHLVLLVLMLHGITLLLESEPRFPISWVHIGFVEFIARTGTTAPDLDARWSWPGFFALAAFWGGSGDLSALHAAVSVASVGTNLLYLVALGLLMSPLRMSWQAKWLAAMFFCLLNWIGQDYFSPQGFALVLYLLFVGFLVVWFRTPRSPSGDAPWPLRPGNRLWRWVWGEASRGELPQRKTDPSEQVVILAVVVGSAALVTIVTEGGAARDYVRAGTVVESVWVRAQALGLAVQPVSPVFLYADTFADLERLSRRHASALDAMREKLSVSLGVADDDRIALVLRVGRTRHAAERSRRRPDRVRYRHRSGQS